MIFICKKCGEPITFLLLSGKNLKEELLKHKCLKLYTHKAIQTPKRKRIMNKDFKIELVIGDISEIHKTNILDIKKWLKKIKNKEIKSRYTCPFNCYNRVLNPCKDLCRVIFENLSIKNCPCHAFGPGTVVKVFQIVCDVHKVYYKPKKHKTK